ncbi:MAG: glucokinase [Candidatus Binatia bacterium]|nr:MAG: glucokinase [Candidatus Binatia bacterium]
MILAVDVGGTRTRVALFDPEDLRRPVEPEQYETARIPSIVGLLRDYLQRAPGWPVAAGVGVAGPVVRGRSLTVNLPWSVDATEIAQATGLPHVGVLNDLEAAAWGLALLEEADSVTLQAGAGTAQGNQAVIAAGTGLGEAGLYWDGENHYPFATEGGHASFAPSSPLEDQLLCWLRQRFDHVSWERVVSGPGLVHIYLFLRGRVPGDFAAAAKPAEEEGISPEAIAERARNGDWLCREALQLFFRLYGAEAANLSLKLMALGGLYIFGNIALSNLEVLQQGEFMEAFRSKGRMRPLLEAIPVRVVRIAELVLLGAARYASLRVRK